MPPLRPGRGLSLLPQAWGSAVRPRLLEIVVPKVFARTGPLWNLGPSLELEFIPAATKCWRGLPQVGDGGGGFW